MATREFTSLLSRFLPSVPGCPQPMAVEQIRRAAIRTCERTLAWRYTPATSRVLPGVHEYAYTKAPSTDVCAVFRALVNDCPLEVLSLEAALDRYPEWADLYSGVSVADLWSETPPASWGDKVYNEDLFNEGSAFVLPEAVVAAAAQPRIFTQLNPDKYVILPLPDNDEVYTLRIFLALKPSRTATDMDEGVFNDLEDAILHAALQETLVMPNVAWSDRQLATYHAKQYLAAVSERRARANHGNARYGMRATGDRFA
jgi:hypothetical protein